MFPSGNCKNFLQLHSHDFMFPNFKCNEFELNGKCCWGLTVFFAGLKRVCSPNRLGASCESIAPKNLSESSKICYTALAHSKIL